MKNWVGALAAGSSQRRAAVRTVSSQLGPETMTSMSVNDVSGTRAGTASAGFPPRASVSAIVSGIILIVIAVTSFSRYEAYLGERIGAQDDYIWLYMTSAKIGDRARGDRLLHELNALNDDV